LQAFENSPPLSLEEFKKPKTWFAARGAEGSNPLSQPIFSKYLQAISGSLPLVVWRFEAL
jgi:hypothetical protein